LIAQLARDGMPVPDTIVVPLGSGGTVAGLLVGLTVAGVHTRVVGVRVVPRSIGNRWHVLRLARRTRALLAQLAGASVPSVDASRLVIEHGAYGGAYGRETSEARSAAESLRASGGPRLDGTYSAKAFGHALARARRAPDEVVLFWLTFDGRWLDADDDELLGPCPPR
jgi:D-cysteine desulfhydrase